MAQIRCYMQTFNNFGAYSGTWVDVTKYVASVGQFSIDTDSTDYKIGVFRNSNVSLSMNNRNGLFNDVDQANSMFIYTRSQSLVKFTYAKQAEGPYCGVMTAGEDFLSEEVEFFRGILNDSATSQSIRSDTVSFQVMGLESIFDAVLVPTSGITAGQNISTVIYEILNQSQITNLLTIQLANITPNVDAALDSVDSLQNETVKAALDDLLLISNSVLVVSNQTVYVKARTPTASVQQTFYGQASQSGEEDVLDINNYNSGLARLFNQITWNASNNTGATAVAQDNASITKYGVLTSDLSVDLMTDTTHQTAVATSIVGEFSTKKRELELVTPLNYTTLSRAVLDRVSIDYPTVFVSDGFPLPICGAAICGTAILPRGIWSFQVDPSVNWKIIKTSIDVKRFEMTFKLREI